MTQIINDLATIEFNDDILKRLDLNGIYDSFRKNYKKLDNLKNARNAHEERNAIMRWWHNDKLQEAQLDSAEVQAEFSKTIGQLMLISIMQSKKLVEQQNQLNSQQGELKAQTAGIERQANQLQLQHHQLAEQSIELKNLVREYSELKGLTDDGAERLIEIAAEIKGAKDELLEAFAVRTRQIGEQYGSMAGQMTALSSDVDMRLHRHQEHAQSAIAQLQLETGKHLAATESSLRERQDTALQGMHASVSALERGHHALQASVSADNARLAADLSATSTKLERSDVAVHALSGTLQDALRELDARAAHAAAAQSKADAELAACMQQQQVALQSFESYRSEVSARLKRLSYACAGLGLGVAGLLAAGMHLLK